MGSGPCLLTLGFSRNARHGRASRSVRFDAAGRMVLDQVGDGQLGVHGSRVDDAVGLAVLQEHLSRCVGMLLAVRVVKIDTARYNRADEDAGVRVPAAVAPRGERQLLYVEIRRSLRLQLDLPALVAAIWCAAHLNLLADTVHGRPHRHYLIDKKTDRWSRQRPRRHNEYGQQQDLARPPSPNRLELP